MDTPEGKIMAAALEVVARNTINGTRMRLIAEEVGMAQSNLHYYYKTKRELLVALLRYIQSTFTQRRTEILEARHATLRAQLTGFFEQKKQIIREERKYDQAQVDYWCLGQADDEIKDCFDESYDIWRGHIMDVIRRYSPQTAPEHCAPIAQAMVAMMMGASLQATSLEEVFDLDGYFRVCADMVMDSLAQ